MTAAKSVRAVRLQPSPATSLEDMDGLSQEAVVVELPSSNKFGFTWPGHSPPTSDQPLSFTSSECDTDSSEAESFTLHKANSSESERATPTNKMDHDQNPMETTLPYAQVPRLSRMFSMPTPSQLRHLRNPRRLDPSSEGEWNTKPLELSPEFAHFHELSLELADSVQVMIQTLLQLSPPQLLDHTKEQLSSCSLSVPTPSMSAIFTCMKNLNYMAKNMSSLGTEPPNSKLGGVDLPALLLPTKKPNVTMDTDFDIGEMLQSVGDSLSGLAAQAGVDLILFHQDVGMKHVAVKGDESGLSYTISYIVRQIIGTAWRGDSVEVGLFIESNLDDATTDMPLDLTGTTSPSLSSSTSRLKCTIYFGHRFSASEPSYRPGSTPPSPTMLSSVPTYVPSPDPSSTTPSRPVPSFNTIIMRRLLHEIKADFVTNLPPYAFSAGRASELVITLDHGSLNEQTSPSDPIAFPDTGIAKEPTLQDLTQFSETLRGKKVTLCATSRGSFAHYISSYLTAWGLDVSHVSIDPQNLASEGAATEGEGYQSPSDTACPSTPASTVVGESSTPPSFVLIDDNADVLNDRLEKLRLDNAVQLPVHSKRRPTLSHWQKSSSQIPRVTGAFLPFADPSSHSTVVVHFTSLANYKRVKDTIQRVLSATPAMSLWRPEIIVIPKPAGPRRVLTTLYTALKKPIVDPFFLPTATFPTTPGIHISSPLPESNEGFRPGHVSRPSGSQRSSSDRSSRSSKDVIPETAPLPSSPLSISDSMEYFSETTVKLGSTPSSGLVIQSPSGQPAGIFFLPGAKSTGLGLGIGPGGVGKSSLSSPTLERERGQFGGLRSPRPPVSTNVGEASYSKDRLATVEPQISADSQMDPARAVQKKQSQAFEGMAQKMSSPPASPGSRAPALGVARRGNTGRRISSDIKPTTPPAGSKKQKGPQDGNIVPPISVLIVDDNPINQTILSTFMKKKKIKYDVAKNGEEAVQKWKSGAFHLILMDIQMPVMDGIQATKEIRRIEKLNGAVGFPSTPSGTPISEVPTTPPDSASSDSRSASTPYRSSVIIVALTASSLQSDRVAALAAGCNDFLTKPVSLHWLNSKIIEWGSIKALQMWADIRPDVVKSFSNGQAAQAQNVAQRLHVPEGRITPTSPRSRSTSLTKQTSKLASSTKPSSLVGSNAPSPETEAPSSVPTLPVIPSVIKVENPANGITTDVVPYDEEILPTGYDTPDVDGKDQGVSGSDGEAHVLDMKRSQ